MDLSTRTRHLTDDELFALALPAAGVPEALPAHLSDCLVCSRALSTWKGAVRDLADEGDVAIARRSPEEWDRKAESTMQAIRGSRFTAKSRRMRWGIGIAASILLFVIAVPVERAVMNRSRHEPADLSAQDQADDRLLRDVARLSRGEGNGSWDTLVPEPGAGARTDEDPL